MDNIYSDAIQKVADGARFKVDLQHRTLTINKTKVIDNGKYEGDLGVLSMPYDKVLENIEQLYYQYKHSVPSERSETKRHRYFKALKETDLSDEDMMYGDLRDEAQIKLELFILCCILNGSFVWPDNRWFWQSEADKDLIILRQWVDSNNNSKL